MADRIYVLVGPGNLERLGVDGREEIIADIAGAIADGTTDGLHDMIASEMRDPEAGEHLTSYIKAIASELDKALGWTNGQAKGNRQ